MTDEFACSGVDDSDVEVVDEHANAASGVPAAVVVFVDEGAELVLQFGQR